MRKVERDRNEDGKRRRKGEKVGMIRLKKLGEKESNGKDILDCLE